MEDCEENVYSWMVWLELWFQREGREGGEGGEGVSRESGIPPPPPPPPPAISSNPLQGSDNVHDHFIVNKNRDAKKITTNISCYPFKPQ